MTYEVTHQQKHQQARQQAMNSETMSSEECRSVYRAQSHRVQRPNRTPVPGMILEYHLHPWQPWVKSEPAQMLVDAPQCTDEETEVFIVWLGGGSHLSLDKEFSRLGLKPADPYLVAKLCSENRNLCSKQVCTYWSANGIYYQAYFYYYPYEQRLTTAIHTFRPSERREMATYFAGVLK